MGGYVSAKIDDSKLRLTFAKVVTAVQARNSLKPAVEVMMASIDKTFKEEGSPAGSWAPLAASTKKRYKKKAAGHKLLVLSRRLKNSIHPEFDGSVARIGTNLKYAAVHQFGSKTGVVAAIKRAIQNMISRVEVSGSVQRDRSRDVFQTVNGRRRLVTKGVRFIKAHSRRRGAQNIPARPYLVFRPEDPGKIEKAISAYIQSEIDK